MRFYGGLDVECTYDHDERKIHLEQANGEVVIGPEIFLKIVEHVAAKNEDFCKGLARIHWRQTKRNERAETNGK